MENTTPRNGNGVDRANARAYQQLARELLLVGPEPANEDLKLRYLDVLIDKGLEKPAARKSILIVGAGIAGLVAGSLLTRAGHNVTILEANANRVGGRIKTFHTKKGKPSPFTDPAQYAEAGAMRLPSFHPLTLALIDKLGLKRRLFFNVDIDPKTGNQNAPVPPVVYRSFKDDKIWTNGDPSPDFREPAKRHHTWIRTNRHQTRRAQYAQDPSVINEGFHLTGCESRMTVAEMVNQALEPVRDYYSVLQDDGTRVKKPFKEWLDGWAGVIRDFDGYSMGRFLREYAGFSDEAIEAIGTIENMTSRLHLAFFHSFLGRSDIDPAATYWEIEGGSRKLPEALAKDLGDQLVMGQRMVRLEYYDPGRDGSHGTLAGPAGPAVAIQTVPEGDPYGEPETWTADLAIVTIPFSSLRFTAVTPPFSYKKRRAVIETHYDQATKVLLEFSRRWWEFTEDDWKRELEAIAPGLYAYYQRAGEDPAEAAAVPKGAQDLPTGLLGAHPSVDEARISKKQVDYYRNSWPGGGVRPATNAYGGGSTTDNPNRFMYYPSHPVPGSSGGVVLAGYSWSDDAARWDSMEDHERYGYALRNLQSVHGRRIEVFYTGAGQTQSWLRDPYAMGEAAVYTPHQMTSFHLDAVRAEGPVHFAGEHVSLKHAWIEGAVETAVRAAIAVNGAPAAVETASAASEAPRGRRAAAAPSDTQREDVLTS
ncbi:flavin monoamine oxidase family protein [Streptomyces gilvosporeus]|uniref:Flavin-containing superfamily amine oxidase n=1 Tax=Streptomyces gilvosporeus TaxID=553510 RepID=A0A1V0TZ06_9ACTN|nr:FAD-dependent oxidoreductase [Streptomyces gilvosporeus]ARF57902.1 flavin-containing superfamily amine oxidase [Streptomyces gilvosporeus]